MPQDDPLFRPLSAGLLHTPNRVWMAPLTRSRARTPGDVPTPLMATYYAQRASAGLLIAEATPVSLQGRGYFATPGIYSDEQVEGWKHVTDAVHDAEGGGGKIVLQLWHVGRVSHWSLQPGNGPPVAPSALPSGSRTYVDASMARVETTPPRALEADEIPGIVNDFRLAARRARDAGFDGVEIHGANGYLLDQFLRKSTNRRTDAWGGTLANRLRFCLDVTDAVLEELPPGRVGYRINPNGDDAADDDLLDAFAALSEGLGRRRLAYLHAVESFRSDRTPAVEARIAAARDAFKSAGGSAYIANGGYTPAAARLALREGHADAVAWGKLFISNPDLPRRFREHLATPDPDASTFYGGGEQGYTDYPPAGRDLRMATARVTPGG